MLLSIVSPVYHAETLIDELVTRISSAISSITDQYEIILVEDGGKDESWVKIAELCKINSKIKGIQLSRNFGQHAAIAAGIKESCGEWVVVMDCDLQDRPEEIPALYRKAMEGYDSVLARRAHRYDGWFKRFHSQLFYVVLSFLSGTKYDSTIANFGIYHRKVVSSLIQVQHSLHYFPTMVSWVGFNQTSINVEHSIRPRGGSSYNFRKKLKLALNIMLTYSNRPLALVAGLGIVVSAMAFLFAIVIIYRALHSEVIVLGYSSLIVSISFFSGIIISILGVLGLYIGKIFNSINVKPSYLINRRIND